MFGKYSEEWNADETYRLAKLNHDINVLDRILGDEFTSSV